MLTFRFFDADGMMTVYEKLTTGMVGKQAKLEFSAEWANRRKTAVFTSGSVTKDVLNVTDIVTIPHEVLQNPGDKLYVGIYGVSEDGTQITPTIYAQGPKIFEGADPSGDESTDATLPVWAQLDSRVSYLEQNGTGGGSGNDSTQNSSEAVLYTAQTLTDEQKAQARANIGAAEATGVIPDYWEPHLAEKIATVKELQRAGKDCYSYVVIADYHRPRSKVNYSPMLIKRIMDECGIKFCLCLGDMQNGGAWKTKALEMADWVEIEKEFSPIRDRLLMIPGNHDGAYGNEDINGDGDATDTTDYYIYNLTPAEMYDIIYRKISLIPGVTFDESCNGYYVDDTAAKVRYILVNTHYSDGATNEDGTAVNNYMRKIRVGQAQQDMVVSALQSIPTSDWNVVVGMHIPLATLADSGPSADMVLLRDVLEAYQNKTTYSNTFGTEGEYDRVSVDVDFSAAKGSVVGVFCGHTHRDGVNTDYAFPVVTSYSDDTSATHIFGTIEADTIQQHSFDVFTVNRSENVIYATKFGYGEDRVIGMGNRYWSVSLTMEGTSASNEDALVLKDGSYTNTITAKAGYEIDTVTVTMGGVDITADVYADGIVTIDKATGDIVITVTSTVLYTNLADPTSEDWYSNAQLSDGVVVENTSCKVVTNFIQVTQGDVVRFMGLDTETMNYSTPTMTVYDENKAVVVTMYLSSDMAGDGRSAYEVLETDENGVTSYTVLMRGANGGQQFTYNDYCTKAKYIRFNCLPLTTIEDIVITVNEEIYPSEDTPVEPDVPETAYTNLADPTSEDWVEKAAYNGGKIAYYEKGLRRATNYIPVTQYDVVRFWGIDCDTVADGAPCIVIYDESKAYLDTSLSLHETSGDHTIRPVMTQDENGVWSYEILLRGSTGQQFTYSDWCTKTKYIRFMFSNATPAEDVIITVNEEIV